MGISIDRAIFGDDEYVRFSERLDECLVALRQVLEQPGFGAGPASLGAELEMVLIDGDRLALPINRQVLKESLTTSIQLELDRFNVECNLTPVAAAGRPFSALRDELVSGLGEVDGFARRNGGRALAVGILPTLRDEDVQSAAMTDLPRYHALSYGLRRLRGEPFAVRIDGVESLTAQCDDVTLEGANTSFQVHLKTPPDRFADTFNAAELATPVALAVCANSPVFLQRLLWDETRIALFKQSVDVRSDASAWRPAARVSYGHGWTREGAWELFAEAVRVHPAVMPIVDPDEAPLDALEAGRIPSLAELRLHQSTVWNWNRPVYDTAGGGHVRVELRALPAGPTPSDMAANAAFVVGLTVGLRDRIRSLLPAFPFSTAQYSFYRAAQHGLDAQLLWPSDTAPSPCELPARALVDRLLPIAAEGLAELDVDPAEIAHQLGIIEARLSHGRTGARWQREAIQTLETRTPTRPALPRPEALAKMLELYLARADSDAPVASWDPV